MFCLASSHVFGTSVSERESEEHSQSKSQKRMGDGKLTSKIPKDIMVCANEAGSSEVRHGAK